MNAPVTPQALGDPWTIPLDQLDIADPQLFQDDVWPDWFARLRRDDPVHFHKESHFGPFWSVTKYADIMTVEATPSVLKSTVPRSLLVASPSRMQAPDSRSPPPAGRPGALS